MVMNFLAMPLYFLSGTFIAVSGTVRPLPTSRDPRNGLAGPWLSTCSS
jgi:hypothetical protein